MQSWAELSSFVTCPSDLASDSDNHAVIKHELVEGCHNDLGIEVAYTRLSASATSVQQPDQYVHPAA